MVEWWRPDVFMLKKENIMKRAQMLKRIRAYFDDLGYLEVETPALQMAPCMEPHIRAFKTEMEDVTRTKKTLFYLHTSPEFAMKKLIVAGMDKIYNICHVFRNAEGSSQHTPEFTMIEWYHVGLDYQQLMDETIGMVRAAAGGGIFKRKGIEADPSLPWEKLTVCEAMFKYAGIDLEKVLDDFEGFQKSARTVGIEAHAGDTWDDLFFRIFMDVVEPKLGVGVPTIIYDYPKHMAALSRLKADDPRFAERFEVYICGLELANAFGELTDPIIQRKRFYDDIAYRHQLYGELYPVDEDFLKAIAYGMRECSGIALGIDRLAMLLCGADKITDVQACLIA
jgi:lysyl-tRNA synthetase class 2